MRELTRRYGVIRLTVGATVISILLSLAIMVTVSLLTGQGIPREGYLVPILAPAIIAPLLSHGAFRVIAQLDQAERRLHLLSRTDELTGACNRRYFIDLATLELDRAERYHSPFSIAILDFDNFKLINDRFGHLAGDRALREVSRICREMIRETDQFARYGGDEFIFLLPQTEHAQAMEGMQRVVERIASFTFESQGRTVAPRVSIGVHSYGPKSTTLDAILEKADLALYKSKQMGGNRVSS
jgi:diguanylate cyclase (GGDEF)-like protein